MQHTARQRARSVPRIPELLWQMAETIVPCSEEYKCVADTVTHP